MHGWNVAPSEFWKMKPRHFWYLFEVEYQKNKKTSNKLDAATVRRLRKKMDQYNGRSSANRGEGNS